jgi:hypothetical protein
MTLRQRCSNFNPGVVVFSSAESPALIVTFALSLSHAFWQVRNEIVGYGLPVLRRVARFGLELAQVGVAIVGPSLHCFNFHV